MSRTIEGGHGGNPGIPDPPDIPGWVHWGDGYAGPLNASRIQGYDAGTLVYRDVAVNANGYLLAGLAVESVEIGTVDQGTPGASAWKVDGSGVTQPVSAASLPLPTGAATGSKQDTGNTSLASIDTKLSGPLNVASHAVTGVDTTLGATVAPKAASVWDVSDRSGRALGTIANTAFQANAGTNLNTSALALDATLATMSGKLPAALVGGRLDVNVGASTSLAVTGPLTDTQLRATPVPVSLSALPALAAGTAVIGHVIVDTLPTVAFTSPQHVIVDSGAENVNATLAADAVGLAKDTSLTSIFGTPTVESPAAFTVLDQLSRIRKTAEQTAKTLQALLAAAQPAPARKPQATLLHRS